MSVHRNATLQIRINNHRKYADYLTMVGEVSFKGMQQTLYHISAAARDGM